MAGQTSRGPYPRPVNSLGEVICLSCGEHFVDTAGSAVTCSNRCRQRLYDRGGRLTWEEVDAAIQLLPVLA